MLDNHYQRALNVFVDDKARTSKEIGEALGFKPNSDRATVILKLLCAWGFLTRERTTARVGGKAPYLYRRTAKGVSALTERELGSQHPR